MERISWPENDMKKIRNVRKVRCHRNEMTFIVSGKEFCFKIADVSPKLLKANKKEREAFEVSPSGYGIHWPLIDEDLSVERLPKTQEEKAGNAEPSR